MATFAFSDEDRERWADEAAGALAALGLLLRRKMAGNIGKDLPSDASSVFSAAWWQSGLDGMVGGEYERIAGEAAESFHEGAGLGSIGDKIRDAVAATVAAGIIGVMGDRGNIVEDRVTNLITEGLESGKDGEWLAEQLALATGDGGPLSSKLLDDYGRGASTGLREGAAGTLIDEYNMDVARTWRASWINTRPTHADADGQEAAAGELFTIGGFPARWPMDDSLPVEESVNCGCFLEYAVAEAAADETGSGERDAVDSGTVTEPIAASVSSEMFQQMEARVIASGKKLSDLSEETQRGLLRSMADERRPTPLRRPAALVNRSWDGARYYGTKAMARKVRTFAPEMIPVPAPTSEPDHTDGIAITLEPTVAEKKMLAVAGGTPPEQIHVTLCYLGTTAELDDTVRAQVSTVLANFATTAEPMEASVAGIGWFDNPQAMTLALIDSPDLAAFRTALVDALTAVGVEIAMNHGFQPHATLGYSELDAADKAGMPLHFDSLRCHWGTDVYVWDLMGATEVPPEPVIAEPEIAPTTEPGAPAMAANEPVDAAGARAILATRITHPDGVNLQARPGHHFIVREGVAVEVATETAESAADDMVPIEADPEIAPAEPQTLADDTLIAELARRAAETAIQEQTDAGAVLTPDDVAAIHATAEEEAGAMFGELVDELAGDAAEGSNDGDWETGPEGDDDAIVLGPAEGYQTGGVVSGMKTIQFATQNGTFILPNEISFGPGTGKKVDGATFAAEVAARFQPGHKGQAFAIEGIPASPAVDQMEWEGPITAEGIPSGDMRMFAEGSLDWRQLPVPMAFLDKITREHQEGELAGWCHQIERRADGGIWGRGTWAHGEGGELVPAAARMQAILSDPTGPGRYGVSVDVDSVTAVYSTPDGQILDPMEAQEAYYAGEPVMEMMTAGRVAGLTAVLHPAFMEAQVWNCGPVSADTAVAIAASGAVIADQSHWRSHAPGALQPFGHAVAASGGVTDITAPPPSQWFELDPAEEAAAPSRNDLGAFRVFPPDDKGRIRVYGVLAPPKECHIGITGRCQVLPTSADFSRFYATGAPDDPWAKFYGDKALTRFYADAKSVICDDGKEITVGPLILDNVHPNLARQASDSQPFYAHTGSAVGDLRLHMTSRGLVASGAIRPGVSWVDVYKVRASSTSPDWRPIGNEVKVIAVLAVNVSGFQLQPIAASGALQYEDLEASIMETAGNVQAIAASAGMAKVRGLLGAEERIAALESTIERMAPTFQVMERFLSDLTEAERRAATQAALTRLGVVDRREQLATAMRSMGITVPDVPCGCSN